MRQLSILEDATFEEKIALSGGWFLDGEPLTSFGGLGWLKSTTDHVFIDFDLPTGSYLVEYKLGGMVLGSIGGKLICNPGETVFADMAVEIVDKGVWRWQYRYKVKGTIRFSDIWPQDHTGTRRQVLLHHG